MRLQQTAGTQTHRGTNKHGLMNYWQASIIWASGRALGGTWVHRCADARRHTRRTATTVALLNAQITPLP